MHVHSLCERRREGSAFRLADALRKMSDDHKAAGNAAFKEGRFNEAATHFTAAIAADPSNAVLFSNRSGALASLGRYEEALADAERATALRPDWAKGFSRKGAALYGLGRYAEAIATYEAGLRAEPGNAQMTQALRDVHARLQAARGLFEAASEGATARVRAALAAGVHPDGYEADDGQTALLAAARLGDAEAVEALLAAGARGGARTRAGESAAALAKKGGHDAVLKLLPAEPRASSLFASLSSGAAKARAAAAGVAEKAAAKAQVVSKVVMGEEGGAAREAGMGDDYDALVRARDERRRRDEAEKAAEAMGAKRRAVEAQLLRKAEEEDMALLKRLAAEKQRSERERAERVERMAAEERQRQQEESADRAAAAERKRAEGEQRAEAERDRAARAHRAAISEAQKAEGNAAFKEGRYADAVQAYTTAIDADGSNATLYSNRSGAFSAAGEYARALADAERAVALRPEWAKGHTRQAAAMHGLGRYMAAVLAYDAALAIEPGNEMLLDARRQSSFTLAVEKD